ncbi:hypothetical protein CTAYLR_006998 [Chrysophaeum taylorii]|uniref:Methyltransferase domain-containing protein n=1 Tax=Chrysophaeum taylorii TaxID=2483200 RepID=A0AAD7UAM2_9STRA|nr:hypothetical protein CTAYLR_006998 [Chrysophaeum taylorii]
MRLLLPLLQPVARNMMIRTAEANDVPWCDALAWIQASGPWPEIPDAEYPAYYRSPFHAYPLGNLCWEAAWEQEIASAAVGARNYPAFGRRGEDAFRGSFDAALDALGARVDDDENGIVLDLGCGTGSSTRRLAARYPGPSKIVGVDLSPYMIHVARRLVDIDSSEFWVCEARSDPRLEFMQADIQNLPFSDDSVSICSLNLVVHEIPPDVTRDVLVECARVLKPGGALWLTEMDFDTPGFRRLRGNPLLFSIIRATEPYLDDYANYNAEGIASDLLTLGAFDAVHLRAATGRHFALIATKKESSDDDAKPTLLVDDRAATALPDTHLATWQTSSRR